MTDDQLATYSLEQVERFMFEGRISLDQCARYVQRWNGCAEYDTEHIFRMNHAEFNPDEWRRGIRLILKDGYQKSA